MSVGAVVDALPAAHSLAMACMQTFTLLLGCHKELPEPLQLQVLTALAQQQRQQQPADQASEEVRVDLHTGKQLNLWPRMHLCIVTIVGWQKHSRVADFCADF
jgi:hypothetical protein